jgi:hypothetical protein
MSSQDQYASGPPVRSEADLTAEQKETLAKLNTNMPTILARFDAVLQEFGIDRQVQYFTTIRQRAVVKEKEFDEQVAGPFMCCCVYGPPDEAPCDECPHAPGVENQVVVNQ